MMTLTILVADDDQDLPGRIGRVLKHSGWKIVRPCSQLSALGRRLGEGAIDIVQLDVMWGDRSALAMLPGWCERVPGVRWCIYSAYEAPRFIADAFEAGALGYVSKMDPLPVLVEGVASVAQHRRFLSPRLQRVVAVDAVGRPVARPGAPYEPGTRAYAAAVAWLMYSLRLSERQAQVALAVHDGLADKEVAVRVRIAVDTVHVHTKALYRKLSADRRRIGRSALAAAVAHSLDARPPRWTSVSTG